ncbi:hypothetical protein CUMW_003340 [Citrus unshiu]|nr:hypothetical protein CUMW_003340 [Citrus unshiu]
MGLSSAVVLFLTVGLSHPASRTSRCSLLQLSLVVGLSHASHWRNCSIIMSCSSTSENRTQDVGLLNGMMIGKVVNVMTLEGWKIEA